MLWGEKRGNKKGQLSPGVQPRTPLAWTASALPLSHDSLTATNPPKSSTCPAQVVLIASVHTWQPFSMCRQNPIRGWLENSAKNPCWMVLFTLDALSILLMLVIKLIYLCYEAESEIDDIYSHRESNSGHVWLELPLNHDSRTTTNPQNSLYVLHRWYWITHLADTQ